MTFWDSVKNVANDVTSEAKGMADKAKLKNSIRAEEQKIYNYYKQIGEKLYRDNASAPAGYEEMFNGIKTSAAEIERLKAELSNSKI